MANDTISFNTELNVTGNGETKVKSFSNAVNTLTKSNIELLDILNQISASIQATGNVSKEAADSLKALTNSLNKVTKGQADVSKSVADATGKQAAVLQESVLLNSNLTKEQKTQIELAREQTKLQEAEVKATAQVKTIKAAMNAEDKKQQQWMERQEKRIQDRNKNLGGTYRQFTYGNMTDAEISQYKRNKATIAANQAERSTYKQDFFNQHGYYPTQRNQPNYKAGAWLGGLGTIASNTKNPFSGAIGGILSGIGTVLKDPATGLATATTKAIVALENFAHSTIEAYGSLEKMRVQMSVVMGSESQANTTFEALKAYATKSPFGVEQTGEMAVLLKQSGVYGSELLDVMKRLGDVSGGNNEKMKQIASNYAKIQAMGNATMLNMRQFAMAGVPIFEEVAKELGVSQGRLRQMTKDGQVTAEVIEKVFKNMTGEGGTFENATERGAQTIAARQQNLADAKQIALAGVGEWISNWGYNGREGLLGQNISFSEDFYNAINKWSTDKNIDKNISKIATNNSEITRLENLRDYVSSHKDQYSDADELIKSLDKQIEQYSNALPYATKQQYRATAYDSAKANADAANEASKAYKMWFDEGRKQLNALADEYKHTKDLKKRSELETQMDTIAEGYRAKGLKFTKDTSLGYPTYNDANNDLFMFINRRKANNKFNKYALAGGETASVEASVALSEQAIADSMSKAFDQGFGNSTWEKGLEGSIKSVNSAFDEYSKRYTQTEEYKQKVEQQTINALTSLKNEVIRLNSTYKSYHLGDSDQTINGLSIEQLTEIEQIMGRDRQQISLNSADYLDTTGHHVRSENLLADNNIYTQLRESALASSNALKIEQSTSGKDLSSQISKFDTIIKIIDSINSKDQEKGKNLISVLNAANDAANSTKDIKKNNKSLFDYIVLFFRKGLFNKEPMNWNIQSTATKNPINYIQPRWKRYIEQYTGMPADFFTNGYEAIMGSKTQVGWRDFQRKETVGAGLSAYLTNTRNDGTHVSIGNMLDNIVRQTNKDGSMSPVNIDIAKSKQAPGQEKATLYSIVGNDMQPTVQIDWVKTEANIFANAINGKMGTPVINAMKEGYQKTINTIDEMAVNFLTGNEQAQYSKDANQMFKNAYDALKIRPGSTIDVKNSEGKLYKLYQDSEGKIRDASTKLEVDLNNLGIGFENTYAALTKYADELQYKINELEKIQISSKFNDQTEASIEEFKKKYNTSTLPENLLNVISQYAGEQTNVLASGNTTGRAYMSIDSETERTIQNKTMQLVTGVLYDSFNKSIQNIYDRNLREHPLTYEEKEFLGMNAEEQVMNNLGNDGKTSYRMTAKEFNDRFQYIIDQFYFTQQRAINGIEAGREVDEYGLAGGGSLALVDMDKLRVEFPELSKILDTVTDLLQLEHDKYHFEQQEAGSSAGKKAGVFPWDAANGNNNYNDWNKTQNGRLWIEENGKTYSSVYEDYLAKEAARKANNKEIDAFNAPIIQARKEYEQNQKVYARILNDLSHGGISSRDAKILDLYTKMQTDPNNILKDDVISSKYGDDTNDFRDGTYDKDLLVRVLQQLGYLNNTLEPPTEELKKKESGWNNFTTSFGEWNSVTSANGFSNAAQFNNTGWMSLVDNGIAAAFGMSQTKNGNSRLEQTFLDKFGGPENGKFDADFAKGILKSNPDLWMGKFDSIDDIPLDKLRDMADSFAASAIAAQDLADATTNVSQGVGDIIKNIGTSLLTDTMQTLGKSIATSAGDLSDVGDSIRDIGKAAASNLGSLLAQAGLSLVTNGAMTGDKGEIVTGLTMAAMGGVASLVAGMMDSSSDDDDDDQTQKLQNLKDMLADLLSQAREDAIYYENELRHRNALSISDAVSGNYSSVNDAIITPSGNVVSTHPDDYLIATKTPGSLVGGGKTNVNFSFIDQSSSQHDMAVEQRDDGNGNIELVAVMKDLVKSTIANGDADDAFTARESRLQGRKVTA